MRYINALESVIDENSLIILGAGFSYYGNTNKGKIKNTNELAKLFYDLSNEEYDPHDKSLDLMDASELLFQKYRQRHGEENAKLQFIQLLKDEFIVNRDINEIYKSIVSKNWIRVYTTNYDNLFEQCSDNLKIQRNSYILTDPCHNIPFNSIIHLNGFVSKLNSNNFLETLKLRTSDYYSETFRSRRWQELLQSDMKTANSIFIIGYSMYDIDLARTLLENDDLKQKTFAINTDSLSPKDERKLFVFASEIKKNGVSGFSEDLNKTAKTHKKSELPHNINAFKLMEPIKEVPTDTIPITDTYDLLVKGKYSQASHWNSVYNKDEKYIIERSAENEIISLIKLDYKRFIITGPICSGKTILIQNLCLNICKNNTHNIFWLNDNSQNYESDINELFKQNKNPIIIVIDSFYSKIQIVNMIDLYKRPDDIIILSERSEILHTRSNKLNSEYKEIDIKRFTEEDIIKFTNLLDFWGFGAKFLNSSDATLKNILKKDCKNRLSDILIRILKSEYITNQLKNSYLIIKSNENMRYLVCLIQIFSFLNIKIDVFLLNSFTPNCNLHQLEKDDTFKIFCNIRNDKITPVSSIFAKLVLNTLEDNEWIFEVLVKIARITSNKYDIYMQDEYYQIFKEIIHSRTIQKIFTNDTSKDEYIIKYYSKLAEIYGNTKHGYFTPLFWLQFAITILDLEQYDLASEIFDKAYLSSSKLENFNRYQIDNHYARYLLEYTIKGLSQQPIDDFKNAHKMIKRQLEDKEMDHQLYPYRRIELYKDVFKNKGLSIPNKVFKEISLYVMGIIYQLKQSNKNYKNDVLIEKCYNDMKDIYEECK